MTSLLVAAFLLGVGLGGWLGLALADAEASLRPFTPARRDHPTYPDPLALPTPRERISAVRLVLPDPPAPAPAPAPSADSQ